MTIPKVTSIEEPSLPRHVITAAVAAGLAIMFGTAYTYSVATRSASEQRRATLIQEERRGFCLGLGLVNQSEPYARCVTGLAEIQRRQHERFEAESAGML